MKKNFENGIIIILFISLVVNFIFINNINNINNIDTKKTITNSWEIIKDKWIEWSWNINLDIEKIDDLYKKSIPSDFELPNSDLKNYEQMLMKNEKYFTQEDDKDFFYIWRNYLFWDNYKNWENNLLFDCLDWKTNFSELPEWTYRQICEWKDIYKADDHINFFHIKDTLIQYKKILNWNNISCDYFITKEYNYPENIKTTIKREDYMFCMKLSTKENLSNDDYLKNEYFYYDIAASEWKCKKLKDTNLQSLCEKEKQTFSTTKKQ